MTKLKAFIYGMAVAMSCTSCIRENLDQCPPLSINIEVKDKNYDNVEQVDISEKEDENQPFRHFIPTLYYRLSRLDDDGSKQMITEKGVFTVEGDAQTYSVDFDNSLPFGKYIFTVWGGIPDKKEFNADCTELSFHPEHAQGYDVYLSSDTLLYDAYHSDFVSQMRRTKGKLIIIAEDLPSKVRFSGKTVEDLYQKVNANFDYKGETQVTTRQTRRGLDDIVTETYLTPTIQGEESMVDAHFYNDDDDDFSHPDNSPQDVDILMRRNELTMLKYAYDEQQDRYHIYVRINNNWEAIHDMDVE